EGARSGWPKEEGRLTSGLVAELAIRSQWGPANAVEGCLVRDLGEGWVDAVNGHGRTIECIPPDTMGWKVEPYHMTFWRNGWMAVDVRPFVEDGKTQEYMVSMGGPGVEAELRELLTRLVSVR